jgi:hypothetical protein
MKLKLYNDHDEQKLSAPTTFATTSFLTHLATLKRDPLVPNGEEMLLHNNILGVSFSHAAHFLSRDIEARQSISKTTPSKCGGYDSVCTAF